MHALVNVPGMLWIVIAYLIGLLAVGWYFYMKAKKSPKETRDDFFLAGRSLGKIVVAGTILATYTGSGTVTGGGNSLAYNYGLWSGICFVLPPIFGILILLLMSKRIYNNGYTTAAELLEKVYGRNARIFAAVIITLAFVSIVSYQYRGLGFILNATTGLSIGVSTIICTFIVIALAFGGGLKTVATTDAISAFLMVGGLALGIPFLLKAVGGWNWVVSNADPVKLTFTGGQTWLGWLGGYLPLLFLTIGDQNFYQRIVASKDLKTARFGLTGCLVACLVIMPVVAVLSFAGSVYFGKNIAAGQSLIATATLMPLIIGGIVLAAAAAFTITTGDSYLLSAATNVTVDIYHGRIKPGATDAQQLKVSRWFILVAGVLAFIILQFFPSVLAIQFWSYTIYGAGITPAVICAIMWKKVTKAGGLASMIIGTLFTIGWEIWGAKTTGIQTVLVAVPLSVFIIIVVSLLTQPKNGKANA